MDDLDLGQTLRAASAGQKVFGRYALVRLLGRGGMGVVWLARDEELDQEVALKFLPEAVMSDKSAIDDMRRETRRALVLTHPHIVRIYDFLRDTRMAAISMEYVAGESLSNRRVERPAHVFEPAELTKWVEQLCAALEYAHTAAKIVHRDLKPANLMVDARGDLKIADFGISATLADTTTRVSKQNSHGSSSGTPVYMSPQQMMGEKPAATDDIYSLGATLYELLTGKPPFYTGNVLLQVQNKVPPSVAARRTELEIGSQAAIPIAWETAIAACLAKSAGARPQSAAVLAAALLGDPDRAFHQKEPAAPPPVEVQAKPDVAKAKVQPRKPLSRGQKWAIGGGAAAVLLIALWQGDVLNRVKASRTFDVAVRKQAAGDMGTALRLALDAVTLRPQVVEYRRTYENLQQRYLDELDSHLEEQTPEQAYATMQTETAAYERYFDGPRADRFRAQGQSAERCLKSWVAQGFAEANEAVRSGRFAVAEGAVSRVHGAKFIDPGFDDAVKQLHASAVRYAINEAGELTRTEHFEKALASLESVKEHSALVPEYAGAVAHTRESQARYEIAHALEAAGNGRYEEAQSMLATCAGRGILTGEVESARVRVGKMVEQASVNSLVQALRRRDSEQAQRIIDRFATLSGHTFTTTAVALDAETDLTKYLDRLTELRLRPESVEPDGPHQYLALVESRKTRLGDPSQVERFLAQEYERWGRTSADAGKPGCALYLLGLAQAHGASIPTEYRQTLLRRASETLGAKVRLPAAESAEGSLSRQAGDLQARFSRYLLTPFSSWLRVSGSGDIVVAFQLGSLETEHNKQESSGSARYQSGTRNVTNPLYPQAVANVQAASAQFDSVSATNLANSSARLQRASLGQNADIGTAAMDISAAAQDTANIIIATKRLNNARANLNNTPEIIAEPVYDTEPYRIIDHTLVHRLAATTTFSIGGKTVDQPLRWEYELKETAKEVVGNAGHGVPVTKPQYLTKDVVVGRLLDPLGPAVEDKNAMAKLEDALAVWVVGQASERRLEGLQRVDLFWCLRELWTSSGQTFRHEADALEVLRQELGLPTSS